MFYGEYEHSIDKKGRLIVPARFRELFKEHYSEKCFVTRGLDKCLFLFTEEDWKQQEKKFKEMPFTHEESRKFNRLYFSGACEVMCDMQGRILVPQYLLDFAGIKEDVMIVGVSDRVEIWAKEKWNEFFNQSIDSFESLAGKLDENKNN